MADPRPSEIRFRKILSKRRKGEALCHLADRMRVKRRTLYWWHQKLAREERERAKEEPQDLVAVQVPGLPALGSLLAPAIEVALRESGHVLRVPARFEADALRQLVDVLERG